jgi:alpha-L-fucosidase
MILRRDFLAGTAAAILPWRLPQARPPVPSPAQLAWQKDELALFLHFGVNTFTDREWGDGSEDPAIFSPAALDARQWARSAVAAGFKAMILTAKHHDGFCLWPTKTTTHSVARSPWRGGGGDLVREFVDACRAEGLKPGLYCSPWDRNAPVYGDSSRYNDMYMEQLTELLSHYGMIHEVWFDGANGEGPNGRRQVYDWPRTFGMVRRLQPEAVMFSDAGPDVRWIGNEKGTAGDPNWSQVNPELVPYPGVSGPGIIEALQHGNPDGTVWRPGETDVSIRPGWFYQPAEDDKVRSVDNLAELYFTSVGRNSKLLLNVPPTREGLLHAIDVARLRGMRERLDALFAIDLARGRRVRMRGVGAGVTVREVDLGRSVPVSIVSLREDLTRGQAVSRYEVTGSNGGAWKSLSQGTTIGYRKLDRLRPTAVRTVRLVVQGSLRPGYQVGIEVF